jgi:hypothetical protein
LIPPVSVVWVVRALTEPQLALSIAHQVPVALFGAELQREAADVALGVRRATFGGNLPSNLLNERLVLFARSEMQFTCSRPNAMKGT